MLLLTLRFSTGPLKGYTLVAHRSGHTLGGSLYTLRPSLSSSLSPASSASSLLYAPLFNHIKEHHLDPTSLLSGGNVDDNMRRMGVMVVGAQRSRAVNIKRIDRERKLLGMYDSSSLNELAVLTDPNFFRFNHENSQFLRIHSPSHRSFRTTLRTPRTPRITLVLLEPRRSVPSLFTESNWKRCGWIRSKFD